jgi:iron complex outermembrane receptor protein
MSRRLISLLAISIALAAIGLFVGPRAQAQTTDSAPTPAEIAAEGGLQEVIVTSTRRSENLQNVPMSIISLTGDQMEVQGIQRVQDVVASVPNVFVSAGPSGASIPIFAMRGIPGAGVFVDGVFQQSPNGLTDRSTLELDRVEVLRGPQGTLFGRDTTGGAIRLFTKLPANEFGARVDATVGSFNRHDVTVNVDIPLIKDMLLTKFTVGDTNVGGYVKSLTIDRSFGDDAQRDMKADILFTPVKSLRVRLTAEQFKETGTQANYTVRIFDSGPPGDNPPGPGFGFQVPNHEYYEVLGIPYNCHTDVAGCPGGEVGPWQTKADFDSGPGIIDNIHSFNLKVDWDITDNINLSSLSSYSDQLNWDYENFSNSNIPFFSQGNYQYRYGWSQEFQLTGHEGPFSWLAGLYGYNDTNIVNFMRWAFWDFKQPMNPNAPLNFQDVADSPECQAWNPASGLIPCIMVPASSHTLTGTGTEVRSVFGEASYQVTKSFKLTLGARYHQQTNGTWNYNFASNNPGQSLIPGQLLGGDLFASTGRSDIVSESFTKPTFHVALTNQFTDNILGYISFSQGYNAGGDSRIQLPEIDPKTGQPIEYDQKFNPETINNYEAGVKTSWFDRRLTANATYFVTDWDDIQVQGTVHDPITGAELPTFLTQNEAAARAKGIELDLNYAPDMHWLFHVNLGTLDTYYTKILPGATNEITLNSKFGEAPRYQYSLGAQYTQNLGGDYVAMARVDDNYTAGYDRSWVPGDQSTTETHDTWEQHAFALLAARLTLVSPNNKWEVSVFGTNLLNKIYLTGGFLSPLLQVDDATIGRPREYGLTLKLHLN